MKYLAILKDSFRETLDSKVLYVTFGLSGILILLLGSVSFRFVPLEEQLEGLCWVYDLAFGKGTTHSKVVEVRQLNQTEEPWQADYQFTLALRFPDEGQARPGGAQTAQLEFFVREMFWWLKDLKAREVQTANPREIHVAFSNRGTRLSSVRNWPHEPSLFFGALPLGVFARNSLAYWVYWIENRLVNTIGAWVAVLLAVVVTASFVPNMLRKGTVDLILSKPIRRPTLLTFKYLGGLTFVLLNALIAIGGIWLVLGLRTGIWAPGFLACTLIITFFFAVLYAVSTLFAVLTRSAIVSILMTCGFWFLLWLVGLIYNNIHTPESAAAARMRQAQQAGQPDGAEKPMQASPLSSGWVQVTVDTLHAVLPRTDDLGALTTQFLSQELLSPAERQQMEFRSDLNFSWAESIGICLAYIAVLLGLACWRFSTRDY